MKPYYEHAGITIYHGDCREILPELEPVDAIITSPPYNTLDPNAKLSGMRKTRPRWQAKTGNYFDQMPEAQYQKWQRECLGLFSRAASCVWINHKTRYREGFAVHPLAFYGTDNLYAEIVWDRSGSIALNCRRFAPSFEYWFCFGRPEHWNNEVNKQLSVWRVAPSKDDHDHPCSYPPDVVVPIIRACVRDAVCDPFMGSGTTLRAAKDLGRKAIGIEIEEKYCEIAAKRLAQEVLPL